MFVYDNSQVVLQFDKSASGNLATSDLNHRYLWGPAVDQLLADEDVNSLTNAALNNVLWPLADHLGTVRDWINSSATVLDHVEYDSFGKRLDAVVVDAAFAWTARYRDPLTGLQWNLNRWYNPAIQRWMSEDPIGFAGGDPNLYRYVGNVPMSAIDPDGAKVQQPGTGFWRGTQLDPSGLEMTDEAMQHGVGAPQPFDPSVFEGGGLQPTWSPFDFFAGIGAGARGFYRFIFRASGDSGTDLGGSYPSNAPTKPGSGSGGGSSQSSSRPDSTLDPEHVWHGDPHAPGHQWDPTVPWKRPPQLQK